MKALSKSLRVAPVVAVALTGVLLSKEPVAPLIIAHRGDSANAPENTAAAIAGAVTAQADLVEFDVRRTTDGKLLLFHDGDLKRFTGEKTTFESLGSADARNLDVGTWFDREGGRFASERPPSLEEAIRQCREGKTRALIERKSGEASDYVRVIRALSAEEDVVVQAFDWKFLTEFRKLAPEIPIGALGSKAIDEKRLNQLSDLAPEWIGWNQKYLTEEDIVRFQGMRARVAVWTVNDLARIRQFIDWGVDALITDRPGDARRVFQP